MHGINEKCIWILVGKPEIGCMEDERMALKWSSEGGTPMGGGANRNLQNTDFVGRITVNVLRDLSFIQNEPMMTRTLEF